ncbi:CoA pyrophosphatase [Sphingomonas sp. 1P06PA]|uniref:CoA pyrophosphatase n=1 Tax=Sphingomonas sp. 1P06PA TaxID=554121 RepID=UPI0039A72D0C
MTLAERLRGELQAGLARDVTLLTGDGTADDKAAAAVLVAVTDRPRPGVLLTVRTETMRAHAGQVAFPGGRLDPGEDAVAAALREAEEEIGLPRDVPIVVGTGDPFHTFTGFSITPVLAVVPPDLPLSPNAAEVADWFEAPLDHVLDRQQAVRHEIIYEGRPRQYYEIMWAGYRIWGVTAALILNLAQRLGR